MATTLVAAIGDIHGRFHRVRYWVEALEAALARRVDLLLAVGDVEAFSEADSHRRKATKRQMPAEFADYASGARSFGRPLYFIGGNNEDFDRLEAQPDGGELAPGVSYLGHSGSARLGGLEVAFLSGIYAPKHFRAPRLPVTNRETAKQAGYFREREVEALAKVERPDLMLVHEWPRGLFFRNAQGKVDRPWLGNPITRKLVEAMRPKWLLCGHSHLAHAATLELGGEAVRVACLDQAAKPDGALLWMEWDQHRALRVGWGTSGKSAWSEGEGWNAARAPRAESD
jgi:Icc-related predicted phosphoesterase